MIRKPWAGDPPVMGRYIPVVMYEETDDEGTLWYVAFDKDGREIERCMLVAGGAMKVNFERSNRESVERDEAQKARLEELDRLRKKAKEESLTPEDRDRLVTLMAIAGAIPPPLTM